MPQPGFIQRTNMYYGDYSFSPVPTFSWNTVIVRDNKDEPLYKQHTLNFAGFLLVETASESGQLDTIIEKQNDLRDALGSGNQEWRITYDGISIVSGIYPKIQDVTIEEGLWVDRAPYSFTFIYDEDFNSTGIKSYDESWQYAENEDRLTVEIIHDINAIGQNTNPSGTNNAFTNAKNYVIARTGYANAVANSPFFVQISGHSFSAYEEFRTEQVNVSAGGYGISEKFTLSSGVYIHTYTGNYSIDENGIVTTQIDGNIRGLGRGDAGFDNALIGWSAISGNFPSVASGIYSRFNGGATLYTKNYDTFSVSQNQSAANIGYSVSYNDDPSEDLPDGIREATFTTSDNQPQNIYVSFSIPLRAAGVLFQNIGTKSVGQFSLNGNIIGSPSTEMSVLENYMNTKIDEYEPTSKSEYYKTSHSITKDEDKKTLQFTVSWDYNN